MNANKYLLTLPATLTSLSIAHDLPIARLDETYTDELEIESLYKRNRDSRLE